MQTSQYSSFNTLIQEHLLWLYYFAYDMIFIQKVHNITQNLNKFNSGLKIEALIFIVFEGIFNYISLSLNSYAQIDWNKTFLLFYLSTSIVKYIYWVIPAIICINLLYNDSYIIISAGQNTLTDIYRAVVRCGYE